MGIDKLQTYLENYCPGGCIPVDLLKIGRLFPQRQRTRVIKGGQPIHNSKFRLVLDGECCLDRLYGGFFSDWACGGQWNRMLQYLAVLIQATEMSGVEFVVFFNGCLEPLRKDEWVEQQLQMRTKVNNVLKHITTKGTPPPKIWWTPPVGLRTSLRMALRHLNVTVLCTMDDHHQEVIAYIRENNLNGLLADDAEYAAFDPPRYFSSEQLKLTYKGSLDTKEYLLPELIKALNIPADRLCIMAALLGNYILHENDLLDFYKKLNISINVVSKAGVEHTVKTLSNFVSELPSVELEVVSQKVFGSVSDPRCLKLRQSIQYYLNGTKEGFFLHYKPTKQVNLPKVKNYHETKSSTQSNADADAASESDLNLGTSTRFASETVEREQESLNAYKQATANAKSAPQIVIDPPGVPQDHGDLDTARVEDEQNDRSPALNGAHIVMLCTSSSSSSSSSATSPSHGTHELTEVGTLKQQEQTQDKREREEEREQPEKAISIPSTSPEVMRTASERHQKGLMSTYIYQILTAGEIKLPVLLEDENHREIPSIHMIYRPIRQMVYAILFNLHHRIYMATKSKEKGESEKVEVPDVIIKEWIWSKSNPYQTPELVKAEQIGWGVPTIQRLWFGTVIDDKRRRLRGFLTCMRSDTPLMLNTSYVPQHLLVMACVLRYIMSFSDKIKILRRQELDAFIAQAFSPELMNAQYLQDLQLSLVTSRGVQLATLFMAGVETALLANDACGAPIPWLMCCPWLYFDGKLFHHTLARATIAKNLLELCSGHIDRVMKVERMRKAILEGITVVFARPPLPVTPAGIRVSIPANILPAGCPINDGILRGRGSGTIPQRGIMRRPIPSRGGQLEIAGVVVGQWGPNYGQPGRLPQPLQGHPRGRIPPQVTSIGGLKYGLPRAFANAHQTVRPSFRGRLSTTVGRGKKTQIKVTTKKKAPLKKNKEIEKKDSKNRITIDGITDYNETTQTDQNEVHKHKDALSATGQFDDAVENGKGMEKGQGDAPLITTEN